MSKHTREEMKREIKNRYSRLFKKLAKEEMDIGSIYNIDDVLPFLKNQSSVHTGIVLQIPKFEGKIELKGDNYLKLEA